MKRREGKGEKSTSGEKRSTENAAGELAMSDLPFDINDKDAVDKWVKETNAWLQDMLVQRMIGRDLMAGLGAMSAPVTPDPARDPSRAAPAAGESDATPMSVDAAAARAAMLVAAGDVPSAVKILAAALEAAPPGPVGWMLPLDPLLNMYGNREAWAPVLEILRKRAE